jgi:hypothetical protein
MSYSFFLLSSSFHPQQNFCHVKNVERVKKNVYKFRKTSQTDFEKRIIYRSTLQSKSERFSEMLVSTCGVKLSEKILFQTSSFFFFDRSSLIKYTYLYTYVLFMFKVLHVGWVRLSFKFSKLFCLSFSCFLIYFIIFFNFSFSFSFY